MGASQRAGKGFTPGGEKPEMAERPGLPSVASPPILICTRMSTETDDPTLAAARAGSRQAIEQLLEKHHDRIFRFGMRFCGNEEDAKDVMQETLLTLVRSLPSFEGRSALSTWLYTVARSFCIKKRRKGKFAPAQLDSLEASETSFNEPAQEGPEPDEALAAKRLQAAFDRELHELEPEQREVLVLRDIEGLPASQVAEVLQISVAAVKSRLHRARLKLREKLAPLLTADVPSPSTSCPDVLALYSQFIEGDIEPAVCQTMERHLASCERCRAQCDSLKRTLSLCSRVAAAELPSEVKQSVREALREVLASTPAPDA